MRNLAVWSHPNATVAAALADASGEGEWGAEAVGFEVVVISKREGSRTRIVESCSFAHLTLHHL